MQGNARDRLKATAEKTVEAYRQAKKAEPAGSEVQAVNKKSRNRAKEILETLEGP